MTRQKHRILTRKLGPQGSGQYCLSHCFGPRGGPANSKKPKFATRNPPSAFHAVDPARSPALYSPLTLNAKYQGPVKR